MPKREGTPRDPHENNQDESAKEPSDISLFRHSLSSYRTYRDIAGSENPLRALDPENQLGPDLTEKGAEFAREEAEKFFDALDPKQDILFFASSNELRAIETTNIYRQVAHQRGFEVIKVANPRSGHALEIGNGEIRVVKNLSLYPRNKSNVVIDSVLGPPHQRPPINWEAIADPELKARYEQAAAIIAADDRGSFGANLLAHSEKIKKLFPELSSATDLYRQFKNIVRLVRFGIEKARASGLKKRVKILAFGHENYLLPALEELFQEEEIRNCEIIDFSLREDSIMARFRGKDREI